MKWKTDIQATRIGLIGKTTAAGLKIRSSSIFVALPSTKALWKIVIIRHDSQYYIAPVLDVGPWNETDTDYVFGNTRPLSEQGIGRYRKPTNKAGIDLSDGLVRLMGYRIKPTTKRTDSVPVWNNDLVDWRFITDTEIKVVEYIWENLFKEEG